ncbi:MAG: hypothetical protein HC897_02470 [Thermoanaerobaculia bacterium]|nr:hypothetical protein [Thermoanaerobaculia bacterium]
MNKDDQGLRRDLEDTFVVEQLAKVGMKVNSIYDLVNSRASYPSAIPTLLALLPLVSDPRIKEGIARALTVKEARPTASAPLLREFIDYRAETKSEAHTKWAIANALSFVSDDSSFAELSSVLLDKRHGWPRSGLVPALANMRSCREAAVQLLLELLDDEEVAVQAMIVLGNLGVENARSAVAKFLAHPDSWVRQRAKRALEKIDRKIQK